MRPNLIFFGSFQHYSAKILEGLISQEKFTIAAVVTTPENPTIDTATNHHIPIFTPSILNDAILSEFPPTDYLVTAGYGKLLPDTWLSFPTKAALNLHFSLLPAYRGANPAEWAILRNEIQTGITLIEMSASFDAGNIVDSDSLAITKEDTRETLYDKLYTLGAQKLPQMLANYIETPHSTPQGEATTPPAKRLKREDGYIPWPLIQKAWAGEDVSTQDRPNMFASLPGTWPDIIERAARALIGYPNLWTIVPTTKGDKRMKLLPQNLVQIEGYQPAAFNQIKNLILQ